MNYQQAFELLMALGQTHLLLNWGELSLPQQEHLLAQIQHIDAAVLKQQQGLLKEDLFGQTEILPFEDYACAGNIGDRELGQEMISEGLMGCLIVAGGQGTRLKMEGPKGMYPITPIRNKSLFALFAEKVLAAGKQVGRPLLLAIMTSPLNHEATIRFFEDNHYFGLDQKQVHFFTQGQLPLLNVDGQLFLEDPCTLAMGPDGNGKALHAFYESGIWQEWYQRGVRYLNFVLIDNPLADSFDAEFLGYHVRCKNDVTVKCVKREQPEEKVGLLARQEGKVVVAEYTEITPELRSARQADGRLLFECANLSLFCFSMDFIKQVVKENPILMPLHKAFKAVKYLGSDGIVKQADEPMAWKFETFIFDVLQQASRVGALLFPRERCFAPLKNFSGKDSPETVRAALQKSDCRTMEEITGVPCRAESIEISPEFYYPTKQLRDKWRGKSVTQSGYVEA